MYHDDTQYFGEDYAKGSDSTAIALVEGKRMHEAFDSLYKSIKHHELELKIDSSAFKTTILAMQQFGRVMRMKSEPDYFSRVQANTRLAKSAVFKRMRELST